MGMGMNFLYGDGYGIVKPVLALPRCHPYLWSECERVGKPRGNGQPRELEKQSIMAYEPL